VGEPILRRVFRHDGDGEDDGDVILRFSRQYAAAIQLPEIRVAGALYRALHRAWAGVVRREGQVPVTELLVEVLQVLGGSARGLFRVLALSNPPVFAQAVALRTCARKL